MLARAFRRQGHEVVVLSRRPARRPWRSVAWDGATLGAWAAEIDGADVVINLAGRSVNCRYTPANRREIMESRVEVDASRRARRSRGATRPPRVWLQASTATIYAHRYDAPNDERPASSAAPSRTRRTTWRFSIDVARAWERALDEARDAAHAQGAAALRDDDEPGPRRRLRHAARPRPPRARRHAPATAGSTCRGSTTRTSCAPSAG